MSNRLDTCKPFFYLRVMLLFMTENVTHLRSLREAAGISLRELARQIDQHPSNVSFWERTGKLPKSDVLVTMAHALGVSVEELLGQKKPRRVAHPGGKLGQVFEAVAELPRRQQQRIVEVVDALVKQSAAS